MDVWDAGISRVRTTGRKGAHALTSFCFMSSKVTCIPVRMVMVELETNLKAFLGNAPTR